MREKERMLYACLGDSITSEQVTGIGTMVCRKLGMELLGNFAFGWATGSDWHDGEETLTPCCLEDLPNEFSPKNVLSNQVRRLLKAAEDKGRSPRVIYIAISPGGRHGAGMQKGIRSPHQKEPGERAALGSGDLAARMPRGRDLRGLSPAGLCP